MTTKSFFTQSELFKSYMDTKTDIIEEHAILQLGFSLEYNDEWRNIDCDFYRNKLNDFISSKDENDVIFSKMSSNDDIAFLLNVYTVSAYYMIGELNLEFGDDYVEYVFKHFKLIRHGYCVGNLRNIPKIYENLKYTTDFTEIDAFDAERDYSKVIDLLRLSTKDIILNNNRVALESELSYKVLKNLVDVKPDGIRIAVVSKTIEDLGKKPVLINFDMYLYLVNYKTWCNGTSMVEYKGRNFEIHSHTLFDIIFDKEKKIKPPYNGKGGFADIHPLDFIKENFKEGLDKLLAETFDVEFEEFDSSLELDAILKEKQLIQEDTKLITLAPELIQEGMMMKHCVGGKGYIKSCMRGTDYIFHINTDGKRGITVHLSYNNKKFRLSQAKGLQNRNVTSDEQQRIDSLIQTLNGLEFVPSKLVA